MATGPRASTSSGSYVSNLAWYARTPDLPDGTPTWAKRAHDITRGSYLDLVANPLPYLDKAAGSMDIVVPAIPGPDGRRLKTQMSGRGILVLDFDEWPAASCEVLTAALEHRAPAGRTALLHTTKSHGVHGPRWRVVLPISRPMEAEDCDALAAACKNLKRKRLGGDDLTGMRLLFSWADASTVRITQGVYPPQYTAAGVFEFHEIKGEAPLDVDAMLGAVRLVAVKDRPDRDSQTSGEATDRDTAHAKERLDRYVARAMDTMHEAGAGGRHASINLAAYTVGGLCRDYPEFLDVEDMRTYLYQEADALKEGEHRTVDDGLEAGGAGAPPSPDFWDNPYRGAQGPPGGGGNGDGGQGAQGTPNAPQAPSRLTTRLGVDAHAWVDAMERTLGGVERIYERAGSLVWMDSEYRTHVLKASALIPWLTQAADWERMTGTGDNRDWTPTYPRKAEVDMLAAQGHWPGVRQLKDVVPAPVLTLTGVVQDPGYHEDAGLFMATHGKDYLEVADDPSQGALDEAVAVIEDLFVDFRFASDSSRAAAWAMLLELPARALLQGAPSPVYVVQAALPGAGKTLLVQAISAAVLGRVQAGEAWAKDEEARRKALNSVLLRGGTPLVYWDNVRSKLEDPSLEAAVTATELQFRVLGGNTMATVSADKTWAVTINGPHASLDTARRAVPIVLDPPQYDEEREYTHPDLVQWATDNHAELLWAVMTVWRAWISAGSPAIHGPEFRSFRRWTQTVRSVVRWLDFADPRDASMEAEADNPVLDLARLLEAWWMDRPMRAQDVVHEAVTDRGRGMEGDKAHGLRDALMALPIDKGLEDKGFTRSLGRWLTTMVGVRNPSGLVLEAAEPRKRAKTYRVSIL